MQETKGDREKRKPQQIETIRRRIEEPKGGRLNIRRAPQEGQTVPENPPRFTWLPVLDNKALYVLRISDAQDLGGANTFDFPGLNWNFLTPDRPLPSGVWYWAYAEWDAETAARTTQWSTVLSFKITDELPETPVPRVATRVDTWSPARPRLWLDPEKADAFRNTLKADPEACGFNRFLERSVTPWRDRPPMPEPASYPGGTRTADVWRTTYIACQELLYAVRHLSVAGHILNDDDLKVSAKAWLLEAASWDPDGPTSRTYSDEWAFRVATALAWGYDWLYDDLSAPERDKVRDALVTRTRQVFGHITDNAKIHLFPYDSHAVRAVSAVLVPCAIALAHDTDEAEDWLNYAIDFLASVYSPWGDEQGGWAEGAHYWMTGMAYLADAANLLRNYCGIDLYQRPFFQKTGDFPLFTKPPDTLRATFGDDAVQGAPVCLKMGHLMSQFARVTGNGAYEWYFEEVLKRDPGTDDEFYNHGWWDLDFDRMVLEHDFPKTVPAPPAETDRLRWFKGIGWAAIQHKMNQPDEHIHFVLKSSPFGSISHSHADQNAFCLSAFGEDLAIQSGHYVAFNSTMHLNWRKQTRSKNALLIDGQGQYAGSDKAKAIKAAGRITAATQHKDHIVIKAEATEAYRQVNPAISRVERDCYFVHDQYFIIVDRVDADEPVAVDWLLHANGPFSLGASSFRYAGKKAGFYGEVVWSSSGTPTLEQAQAFDGVDPSEYDGLPVSSLLTARFRKSKTHRIATLLVPHRIGQETRIFNFIDDQGFDCGLYFTDAEENSFRIVIPKNSKEPTSE